MFQDLINRSDQILDRIGSDLRPDPHTNNIKAKMQDFERTVQENELVLKMYYTEKVSIKMLMEYF